MAEARSLKETVARYWRCPSAHTKAIAVRELLGYMECIKHHGIPQERQDLEDAEEILKEWFHNYGL